MPKPGVLKHFNPIYRWRFTKKMAELIDKEEGLLKDFDIDETTANKLIMKARESWFEDDTNSGNNNSNA